MTRQPVFDFHARLAPQPQALDRLLETMDSSGLDRTVVSAGGMIDLDVLSAQVITGDYVEADADNDAVLRDCARADGRLVPFFFANPHRPVDHYLSQASAFRGLELAPAVHGVALSDERTAALAEAAGQAGHPVYLHCLLRPGFGVTDLADLAARFPHVDFVLGHCGFTNIDLYAINVVTKSGNIWVETSGGYTCVLKAAIERLGDERLLFGSEYPLQHPSVELAKFSAIDLSARSWERIAWRNAHRLLREE